MTPILGRAGLTADAELVYRALVAFGQTCSASLAGELGLSHGRVLTALSGLHAAGLASTRGDGVGRRWQAGTREVPKLAPAHVAVPYPERFAALTDKRRLGEDLYHLTSRPAAQSRLDEIYQRGPKEMLTIIPGQGWNEATLKATAQASHWMAAAGMTMRELSDNPPDPDLLVPYGGLRMPLDGYRRLNGIPMKLIIFDRRVAFFPVDPGNFELGYLEVSQPPIVESLVAMFEKHWAGAEKFVEETMSDFQLSQREQAVVKQLVLGHTDAAAARALHISERTVSTVVRSLMERLDVRNRFQLGVALGKLDAAPLPPPAGRERDGSEDKDSYGRWETGT